MMDLRNVFFGLVKDYRSLQLRFDTRLETRSGWTTVEIAWLARLGAMLGFDTVFEKDLRGTGHRVDLCWSCHFTTSPILHVERENSPSRIEHTVADKLLPSTCTPVPCVMGVFDELAAADWTVLRDIAVERLNNIEYCSEALFVGYSALPRARASSDTMPERHRQEWDVNALWWSRRGEMQDMKAVCSTDQTNHYIMRMVDPPPH